MRQQVHIGVRTLAALAVVLGMVGVVISTVSASVDGSRQPVAQLAQDPSETGDATITVRFCDEDLSDNPYTNCNQRIPPEDTTVTFVVTDEAGNEVDTVVITELDQGDGTQGSIRIEGLPVDGTFTVCQEPVKDFVVVPLPSEEPSARQEQVQGEPCMRFEVNPGNNVLDFNNFYEPAPAGGDDNGNNDDDVVVPGDQLPDTGHGPASVGDGNGMTTLMLGASAASLLTAGWLQLRFRGVGIR